jgi:outer membrane protein assembly factor BamA
MSAKKPVFSSFLLIIGFALAVSVQGQPDSTPKKSHNILLFPLVAKSIETGWSFGVAGSATFHLNKLDTTTRTSNLQALALYTANKQFLAAVNGTQYFKKEKYILNEQLSYSSFPDKFWGLGNRAPDSAEEAYSFKQYYIYLHLLKHLGRSLYVGSIFEFQNLLDVDYKSGGIFDKQQINGRYPYKVSGLGLSLTYDNRNNAFAPDNGNFIQLYFNHFSKTLGSDFVYTNIVLDARKFIRLYKQQVLALQLFSFTNTGQSVPLRSLASFGGNNSMRGYYDGRFRDKQQMTFQAEYRFPIYKRFGMVAFGGIGDVAHDYADFSIQTLKYSFGSGLRFALNRKEKLNLRIDYGIAKGGNSGLYLELGEAF